ncbi:MmgE/PrpD family protein [Rhizobium leguminosarum]|uniref:MmgE/PrpD family protein n=1 Tax=Rhizobium leguminosarum TaxID=384 RepID=UPI00197FF556|nr:MmgE/PrpD family protein [Rhizobium leguminosarum]
MVTMPADDFSRDLAKFVSNCRYEDLPAEAVEAAKKSILDLLGVSLAASGTVPAVRGVMEFVRDHGGKPQCSVLGFGDRVPPIMAAFANGAMAHCLDFDDMAPDGNHASSTLIPAVFAAAEYQGGLSGQDLITAVAIGQDIFLRMRRSLKQRLDWLVTTVLGVFSATAGVSYVLRLREDQVANAFGIASLGSCGTLEMRFGTGSDLGELYAGFVAKSAVMSGMLAKNGVTGTQRVFEGQAGIMKVYFGGEYDRTKILDGLGTCFKGASMQYKPWPVCGIANTYIHAILKLVREHDLKADDIQEIRPFVGDFQQRMSYPLEERRRPTGSMDARFSLPFCVAVAATYGRVGVEHFTEQGLQDQAVLAMAQKVVPVDDSKFDWTAEMPDARVEIDTRRGLTIIGTGKGTPGSNDFPLEWTDLVRKFTSCAALAAQPKSSAAISDAAGMVRSLEQVTDATKIIRLLS